MSRRTVVLSDKKQFEAYRAKHPRFEESIVYCDNERFYAFLKESGVEFRELTELSLRSEWNNINSWGVGRANEWIRIANEAGFFRKLDWPSAVCVPYSYILVNAVKNLIYAKKLVAERPGAVVVFEGGARRRFPHFSGNLFLNTFLEKLAVNAGIPVERISLPPADPEPYLENHHNRLVASVKKAVKSLIVRLVSAFSKVKPGHAVLAHGSLRHLASTLVELRARKVPVGLYDFDFHFEQFSFCFKNGIPYWIPACVPAVRTVDSEKVATEALAEMNAALRAMPTGFFVYAGFDMADFISECIFADMKDYFRQSAPQAAFYEALFSASGAKVTLVDEDYGVRGSFLAAVARSRGLTSFCLSHANVDMEFEVPASAQVFAQSWTFVQSEFEKRMYVQKGWDPGKVIVSGTPRYDVLAPERASRKTARPKPAEKLKVLYPSAGLWLNSPDLHGHVGNHIVSTGDIQRSVLIEIAKAMRGLPVELWVKTHSYESEPMFQKLIAECRAQYGTDLRFVRSSESFLKILTDCDVMMIGYWSTAMIESAFCRVPTLYVDLVGIQNTVVNEFAGPGFCSVVTDAASMEKALRGFSEAKEIACSGPEAGKEADYYVGKADGKSTKRVCDFIANAARLAALEKRG